LIGATGDVTLKFDRNTESQDGDEDAEDDDEEDEEKKAYTDKKEIPIDADTVLNAAKNANEESTEPAQEGTVTEGNTTTVTGPIESADPETEQVDDNTTKTTEKTTVKTVATTKLDYIQVRELLKTTTTEMPDVTTVTVTDGKGNAVDYDIEPVTDEDGSIIGYKVYATTETTVDGGKESYTESYTVYATETTNVESEETAYTKSETTTTTETETVTETTTKVTSLETEEKPKATEDIQQKLVTDGEGNYYLVVTGSMSDVYAGDENGRVILSMTQVDPDLLDASQYDVTESKNLILDDETYDAGEDYPLYFSSLRLMSSVGAVSTSNDDPDDGDWYIVYLTELQDANNPDVKYYAMCSDAQGEVAFDAGYTMQNIENAYFYDEDGEQQLLFDEESTQRIKAIAENGYWAAANTTDSAGNPVQGSLDYVKQLLIANLPALQQMDEYKDLTEEDIDALTEGAALAATQTALWTYANE
jgi:hypothetical protein